MIIGIDMGHTVSGANTGAVGLIDESVQTRILGNKVISLLKSAGHTVINCSVDFASSNSESINKRVASANKQHLDIFVSIHFNAGGGQGSEVLTYNGKSLPEAERVLNNLSKIGFRNRGIKNGTSPRRIGVVNSTKSKSMLIEVCFVDTKSDVDLYKSKIDEVAKAISNGIIGGAFNMSENKPNYVPYDENPPKGANVLPNCKKAYIEETSDDRLIIHMDRGNYISLGKGECKIYLNDNKGKSKVHKFEL